MLAIDLGNANTRLYGRERGLLVDEPTVLTMTASTHRAVAVGRRAKAMLELCADIADLGIFLVGGTARLPGLVERISAETGIRSTVAADPDRAVVRGSARCVEDHRTLRVAGRF
jgi:actin-like ATPase involved in cell morphogenesis